MYEINEKKSLSSICLNVPSLISYHPNRLKVLTDGTSATETLFDSIFVIRGWLLNAWGRAGNFLIDRAKYSSHSPTSCHKI